MIDGWKLHKIIFNRTGFAWVVVVIVDHFSKYLWSYPIEANIAQKYFINLKCIPASKLRLFYVEETIIINLHFITKINHYNFYLFHYINISSFVSISREDYN